MSKFNKLINHLKKSRKIIRMTIVGDGAVGKTTLVKAMLSHAIKKNGEKHTKSQNEKIDRTPFMEIEAWNYGDLYIQCYDLAGQREVGSHPLDIIKDQVLSYIDIYIFVFSLNRFESFENLNDWMELMGFDKDNCSNGQVGIILVGNKSDLERNVSKDLVESVMCSNDYFQAYVETSATDDSGIEDLLNKILILGKSLINSNN